MGRKRWKKLLGVSKLQRNASRKIGIPLSHSGRQSKFGRGSCLVAILVTSMVLVAAAAAFAF